MRCGWPVVALLPEAVPNRGRDGRPEHGSEGGESFHQEIQTLLGALRQ